MPRDDYAALAELAGGFIHEIKNHLGTLGLNLQLLAEDFQEPETQRERLLRAEAEVRDAKLSALRHQLNPHFLFNSLNAVSTLILEGDAPAATRMLSQIGELLRTSLNGEVVSEVPLAQEIAFTERYLAM